MQNIPLLSSEVILMFMLVMYIIAQVKKDNSIVDIGWGIGFIALVIALLLQLSPVTVIQKILAVMILAWGLRLSVHIFLRARGRGEDFRYAKWRKDWGRNAALIAFFKVFMLQGVLMLFISSPILVLFNCNSENLSSLSLIGLIIFCAGFVFESIGDLQLTQFKKKPENKGRIITSGLWGISRHPNYFGETVLWWGIGLFVFGASYSPLAFVGPLLLNFLLLKVSGIPLLEVKYSGVKEWETYKIKTPAFIPFIGKKG